MIDAYNAADSRLFAFLLSTRAGGQGINLTSADTVIVHDLDWNPQLDRQAIDRAHRFGQTRPVRVMWLVTSDTVEQTMLTMQQRKRGLDTALLGDRDERRRGKRTERGGGGGGGDSGGGEELPEGEDGQPDATTISRIIHDALAAQARGKHSQ